MSDRVSWSQYFLSLAGMMATRATCTRAQVGAVIVRDHIILASGYNGSPPGWDHCTDEGCIVIKGHCVRTIHAERNALNACARQGVSTKGATLYTTHPPCLRCFLDLVSAGVLEFVYPQDEIARSAEEQALIDGWVKHYGIVVRKI